MTREEAIKQLKQVPTGFTDALDNEVTLGMMEELKGIKVKESFEALESEKQPNLEGDGYADGHMVYDVAYCPECGELLCEDGEDDRNWGINYCYKCGQKLNWDFKEVDDEDN